MAFFYIDIKRKIKGNQSKMNKSIMAIAVLAITSTYALADNVDATVDTTPMLTGSVSLDFAETTANKTAGTMGVELDFDAGDIATVDLDFKASDDDSLKLDTWTVGTTVGTVDLAFGDNNNLMPETSADQAVNGSLAVPVMTESLQVTMGGASIALGLTDWNVDVTEVSNLQGAYTVDAGVGMLTASADYNRTSENTVLGGALTGVDLAGLTAGGMMTYDTDASAMAYEGTLGSNGLTAYLNGSDDNKLQHVGGEYVMAFNGAELSAGVDYDTDAEAWSPFAGVKFSF
ncbi:MAG: hypothetical protein CMN33_07215 [Saprospirales bacterium]|nr:hypothetical protein [Saprospirales bacterium]